MAKRSGAWALARLALQSLLVGGFVVLGALALKLVQEIIRPLAGTLLYRTETAERRNIRGVHHENINEGKV